MDELTRCGGCPDLADPAGVRPTVLVDGRRWHLECMPARARHGLDQASLPPLARPPKGPPPAPVSQDPEAIRRLRRR
jgi:hypothetical protein